MCFNLLDRLNYKTCIVITTQEVVFNLNIRNKNNTVVIKVVINFLDRQVNKR